MDHCVLVIKPLLSLEANGICVNAFAIDTYVDAATVLSSFLSNSAFIATVFVYLAIVVLKSVFLRYVVAASVFFRYTLS